MVVLYTGKLREPLYSSLQIVVVVVVVFTVAEDEKLESVSESDDRIRPERRVVGRVVGW